MYTEDFQCLFSVPLTYLQLYAPYRIRVQPVSCDQVFIGYERPDTLGFQFCPYNMSLCWVTEPRNCDQIVT